MLDFQRIESQVNDLLHTAQVPGIALAILFENEVRHARGFGVTSVEDGGQPVTPETIFRIGSVTKPLTGAMVMALVDRGGLNLDVPLVQYVPWFRLSDASQTDKVTPRRLLSHTAGLPSTREHNGRRDPEGLEDGVPSVMPELVAPVAIAWSYGSVGADVAGIGVIGFLVCPDGRVSALRDSENVVFTRA